MKINNMKYKYPERNCKSASIHQFNNYKNTLESEITLNVSGRKLANSTNKTIWDYNPDELKVIKFIII